MAETFYRAIRLNSNLPDPSLTYAANDAQVGDLDGDGVMEIVLKRQPYDGANQGRVARGHYAARSLQTGRHFPLADRHGYQYTFRLSLYLFYRV